LNVQKNVKKEMFERVNTINKFPDAIDLTMINLTVDKYEKYKYKATCCFQT